jgi:hypothetical protein
MPQITAAPTARTRPTRDRASPASSASRQVLPGRVQPAYPRKGRAGEGEKWFHPARWHRNLQRAGGQVAVRDARRDAEKNRDRAQNAVRRSSRTGPRRGLQPPGQSKAGRLGAASGKASALHDGTPVSAGSTGAEGKPWKFPSPASGFRRAQRRCSTSALPPPKTSGGN